VKISLSIPTFNRPHQIISMVHSMSELGLLNIGFQVDIFDCSTDEEVVEQLKNLSRLNGVYYHSSEKKISASENYLRAITEINADYVLFCTDKDFFLADSLLAIRRFLADVEPDAVVCRNAPEKGKLDFNKLRNQIECSVKACFLSIHPTGYIFRTSTFPKVYIEEIFRKSKRSPFIFDFLFAEMIPDGRLATMDGHFFVQEGKEESANFASLSYRDINSYYFSIYNRSSQALDFLRYILGLKIDFFVKKILQIMILYRLLAFVYICLPRDLKSDYFRRHYCIADVDLPKILDRSELIVVKRSYPLEILFARIMLLIRFRQ